MVLDACEQQRIVIDDAVRSGNFDLLLNLIYEVHQEETEDFEATYLIDAKAYRHDILCEISESLVRNNAAEVFTDIFTRYLGRADIKNMPTYSGGTILDLAAAKPEAAALCEAIKRAGGTSFPIKLRERDAKDHFIEWNRRAEIQGPHVYLDYAFGLSSRLLPDYRNVIMAAAVTHALRDEWDDCRRVFGRIAAWKSNGHALTDGDRQDMAALMQVVSQKEVFEFAAEIRNMLAAKNTSVPANPAPPGFNPVLPAP